MWRSCKCRIILILGGLIIGIMLLETSLRFAALIYSSDKLHNTKIIFKQNSNRIIKILCVGDSFTFGSGAHRGYSYPEQLQRILNEREPERFIVFNYGVPGNNSSQLFKNIDKLIQRINPDVMLIMTGANNSSNFAQSNYFYSSRIHQKYAYIV